MGLLPPIDIPCYFGSKSNLSDMPKNNEKYNGMSMGAPKWDHGTSPQHQSSKFGWSQHSDSALKVCDI